MAIRYYFQVHAENYDYVPKEDSMWRRWKCLGVLSREEAMLKCLLFAVMLMSPRLEKRPYSFEALFVEGCSCHDVCAAEITGADTGCHGLGAIQFYKGQYGTKSIADTRAAWAFTPEKTVVIYVDAPEKKRAALTSFMKAALADWGKFESVKSSPIKISNVKGAYTAIIGNGSQGRLEIKSDAGGSGGVKLTNLKSLFHNELLHGQTTKGSYSDVGHHFEITRTNAYYYPHCVMHGRI
jgi:hypothetical protein